MPDDSRPRMDDPARDAHLPLPGEQTAHDMAEAEDHFLNPDTDLASNRLHAAGGICARCGQPLGPHDDVRRTVRGTYQHEDCGLP